MRRWLQTVAVMLFPLTAFAQFNGGKAPSLQTVRPAVMAFEANAGQSDRDVRFIARGSDYTVFVTNDEVVFTLQDHDRNDGVGADASQIRLRSIGTRNVRVDPATGDVVADAERGTVRHHAPAAEERSGSAKTAVKARFRADETLEALDIDAAGNAHLMGRTANNSATDTITLVSSGDLAITKTDGVTTATPGGSSRPTTRRQPRPPC
jgi:hypothetical protein